MLIFQLAFQLGFEGKHVTGLEEWLLQKFGLESQNLAFQGGCVDPWLAYDRRIGAASLDPTTTVTKPILGPLIFENFQI